MEVNCQFWVWCYCWTWSKSKGHLHTWQHLLSDSWETLLLSASYDRDERSKIWCSCHSERKVYDLSYPEDGGIGSHLVHCMASHPRGLISEQIPILFLCVCVCVRARTCVCMHERLREGHTHLHHHTQLQNLAEMSDVYFLTLYDDNSSSSSRIIQHLHEPDQMWIRSASHFSCSVAELN